MAFPDIALKDFTHRAAAAAALSRAIRFAKVMLHVTKMSRVVKEMLAHARQETRLISAEVSLPRSRFYGSHFTTPLKTTAWEARQRSLLPLIFLSP